MKRITYITLICGGLFGCEEPESVTWKSGSAQVASEYCAAADRCNSFIEYGSCISFTQSILDVNHQSNKQVADEAAQFLEACVTQLQTAQCDQNTPPSCHLFLSMRPES